MSRILRLILVASRGAETKPNVVIFLADDAGWGDYGHPGNTQVATPHIESIARGDNSSPPSFNSKLILNAANMATTD